MNPAHTVGWTGSFVRQGGRAIAFAALLLAFGVFLLGGSSSAAVNCSYDSSTNTVTITSDAGDMIAVSRTSSGAIVVNGNTCGDATVSNTSTIEVDGNAADQTLRIDFRGHGGFQSNGTDITFDADLGGGSDLFEINGDSPDETFGLGTESGNGRADLHGDSEWSVTVQGAEDYLVRAGDGADTIDAGGDSGMGIAPLDTGATFEGGPGGDTITGGAGGDVIAGGDGGDTESGEAGNDVFDQGDAENGGDDLNGGAGEDAVDYSDRSAAVAVTSGDSTDNDGEGCPDTITCEGDNVGASASDIEVVRGGSGDDELTGRADPDTLVGNGGADTLNGGDGADTLNGGDGDDVLNGDAGADVVDGGPGLDTLNGGDDGDTLRGRAGDDTLAGGAGDDTENGGAGDDEFAHGGAANGADTLNGGAGTDTADYSARTNPVTVTSGDAAGNDGENDGGEGDNVGGSESDVEEVLGGGADDDIEGRDGSPDMLAGGGGNDFLRGLGGEDELAGGDGADTVAGGPGHDTLDGGAGEDDLFGGAGDDTANGGADADRVRGGDGLDELNGDAGIDELFGGADDDVLNGGDGNDTLFGDVGADTLNGDAGADELNGGDGDDVLDGGEGDDNALHGNLGDDELNGGPGADALNGDAGADALNGDAGADVLNGDAGNDQLDGGEDGDELNGGEGNDQLDGGPGDDVENGGPGEDVFSQGDAANGGDDLNGDADEDTVDYSARTTRVVVTSGDTSANDGEGCGGTLGTGCEGDNVGANASDIEVVSGGSADDSLTGSSGEDTLDGKGGADELMGGEGSDLLFGSEGDDTLDGEAGDDVERGGPGADTFDQGSAANGADLLSGGEGPGDAVDYSARTEPVFPSRDSNANNPRAEGADDGEDGEGDNIQNDVEDILVNEDVVSFSDPSVAEGATHSGFSTFVLVSNQSTEEAASVDVTYLTATGPAVPVAAQGMEIPPGERRTISVNSTLGGGGRDAGFRVLAFGGEVSAELSVVRSGSLAQQNTITASAPSDTWIVAEGATHSNFRPFVLVANPGFEDATVDVRFLTGSSGEVQGPQDLVIPAGERRTISVQLACGCVDDVSTVVEVEEGPGVVTNLSHLRKAANGDLGMGGSIGATSTASTWVVPEGATHSGWDTFVQVANPNDTETTVDVTFLTGKQGGVSFDDLQGLTIDPGQRQTIGVDLFVPNDDVSTLVEVADGEPGVVVESAIFRRGPNGFVIGDSVASPGADVPGTTGTEWLAVEGASHSNFVTFAMIANPDTESDTTVDVTFLTGTQGAVDGPQDLTIPAGSRRTIAANLVVPGEDVSTLVEVDGDGPGVVVEVAIDRRGPRGMSKGRSLVAKLAGGGGNGGLLP